MVKPFKVNDVVTILVEKPYGVQSDVNFLWQVGVVNSVDYGDPEESWFEVNTGKDFFLFSEYQLRMATESEKDKKLAELLGVEVKDK